MELADGQRATNKTGRAVLRGEEPACYNRGFRDYFH